MGNAGIIRNRQKIEGTIVNARGVLAHAGRVRIPRCVPVAVRQRQAGCPPMEEIRPDPATSKEADAMSKALKARGFKFVGPTICYAFMQASGMVNDHLTGCFRYHELTAT